MPRSLIRLAATLFALGSTAALACPVCGYGSDGSEAAYIGMTAVLSLLPLAMMGGVVVWLWRSAHRRHHAPQPPAPVRDASLDAPALATAPEP